jgi:AraC-like DNA-binding protein
VIADELSGTPFDVVDDPEGSRQVVGLRLRSGVREPGRALLEVHRRLTHLAGDYGVRSVDLPFATSDLHPWVERFGARVRPGRPVGLLRLPAGVLSAPAGRVPRSALAWRVRSSLAERLGGPAATLGEVARAVAVHPRTLQRALGDEGLTFAEILDCVRRERARGLLTGTGMPFTEVSARLGFAEPAVLTRCVRRWWGRTPSQVRAAAAVWADDAVEQDEHGEHRMRTAAGVRTGG